MTIQILFEKQKKDIQKTLVLPIDKNLDIQGNSKDILSNASIKQIEQTITATQFKGKPLTYEKAVITEFDTPVILMGIGDIDKYTEIDAKNWGGSLAQFLRKQKISSACLIDGFFKNAHDSAVFLLGVVLGNYKFTKYFTTERTKKDHFLESFTYSSTDVSNVQKIFEVELKPIAEATYFARDIMNEPGNIINPESLAEEITKLHNIGLDIEVLNEADMQKLGMNALLSVGRASDKESQLVIMKWSGADNGNEAPVAFVGKGVTFDTGGISIKPSANMGEMKFDMGGSAAVIGSMITLAKRKARVNAIGIVGLAENMVSSSATRPGDIVKSMSGQTIEINNTDAEGRLVLADAIWYCQDRFKPKFVIDFATLTGAILICLGTEYAGLFSNNDDLAKKIYKTGDLIGEKSWRLPLHENYNKLMDSDYADMDNTGKSRYAGSITAAEFLQRFIIDDTPWAHLDIAGVGWTKKNTPTSDHGPSGYGIMLIDRLVRDHYENKK